MIITDVRKRRGRLYQLYLDGEPAVTVDAAAFDESPYRMGGRIDDDQLRELLEAGSRRRAREKALYLLSMRDHSRGELEQKLRQTAGAQAAEETAARMEELGLVDDEAYARRLARDLLAGKGIDRALAEEAAAEAMEEAETDDGQQALDCCAKNTIIGCMTKTPAGRPPRRWPVTASAATPSGGPWKPPCRIRRTAGTDGTKEKWSTTYDM